MSDKNSNEQSKVRARKADQQNLPSGQTETRPQRAPNGWFLPGNVVSVGNSGPPPRQSLAKLSGDIFTAIITRNRDRILEIFDFLFTSENPNHWALALKYLPLDKLMAGLNEGVQSGYDFTRTLFKKIAELEAEVTDLKAKIAEYEGRTIDG